MSLRDQLLKAGLVSEEKVKAFESGKKSGDHRAKKDRQMAAAKKAETQAARQALEAEAARKRARDRELNDARRARLKQREDAARAHQLMDTHRVTVPPASEQRYNFQQGKYIRSIRVGEEQQRLLAAGRLGIIRNDRNRFDYPIVPRDIALKLQAIHPSWVLCLHDEGDPDADPFADWD